MRALRAAPIAPRASGGRPAEAAGSRAAPAGRGVRARSGARAKAGLGAAAPVLLAAALTACSGGETGGAGGAGGTPPVQKGEMPYEKLSDYGFFRGDMAAQDPADGVFPYEVAASLWADNAGKARFLVPPKGTAIGFTEGEGWGFPLGTIVIKTFFFPADLRAPSGPRRVVETRLLILEEEGWTGHTYLWNDEQTEATRLVAGQRVTVEYVREDGEAVQEDYLVPNTNQCKSCHERDDASHVLGIFTHQMNRDVEVAGAKKNQLEHWAELGLFAGPIPPAAELPSFPNPMGEAPLDARARAYLHANCSHCHRPGGGGGTSGLELVAWQTDPAKNGVCKPPVAAGQGTGGRPYDIVPGHPEQSILIFRMGSTDPEIKMPELPNRLPDQAGIDLISTWIAAMVPKGCGEGSSP